MNVIAADAPSSGGGRCGVTAMDRGHGCRGSAIMRGTDENGCPAAPAGLKNRSPSKWSLVRGVTTRS